MKFGFICIEALLSTDGAVTTAVHVGNESSMDGVGFQRLASSRQCTGPRFCGFEWTCQGNGGPMPLKKMALSSGMEFLTIAACTHSLGSWPSAPTTCPAVFGGFASWLPDLLTPQRPIQILKSRAVLMVVWRGRGRADLCPSFEGITTGFVYQDLGPGCGVTPFI